VFTAVLDTCVLWASQQRDFLLSLAAEGLYRPIWSATVLAELEYEEEAKLRRRGASEEDAARRAARLISEMRAAFDDAEIQGWELLEGSCGLPDPDDEHWWLWRS
jgi:PIN domain